MIGYLHIAVGRTMRQNDWSYIDALYFWMVTLTTVGFGDLNIPLWQHAPFFPYRVFGLALLAGVIDSLSKWMKSRKAALERITSISRNVSQIDLTPSYPTDCNMYGEDMTSFDNTAF